MNEPITFTAYAVNKYGTHWNVSMPIGGDGKPQKICCYALVGKDKDGAAGRKTPCGTCINSVKMDSCIIISCRYVGVRR